ncbi:MAG TPA: hypothetical protein VHX65_16685 [Pirellulales bacterium]|nr:hypothetical protein [Pirellulales bacterium]
MGLHRLFDHPAEPEAGDANAEHLADTLGMLAEFGETLGKIFMLFAGLAQPFDEFGAVER